MVVAIITIVHLKPKRTGQCEARADTCSDFYEI
jgi:hypothetical protein